MDFGHFIDKRQNGFRFFRLITLQKKYLFISVLAAGFCPKNLGFSFCPKNNGFARVWGQPIKKTPGSYAYAFDT